MRLSVCIPTYNFGHFISETLHSILTQKGAENIEIVVVDGASTDNTADIVETLQKQYPQIKYHKLPAKGGIDRDMAKSVDIANGEYCWLFGSDDIMRDGALQKTLDEINQGADLYLCKDIDCTLDMRPRTERDVLKVDDNATFNLTDPKERIKYFGLAENTVAFFSYMSVLIIKKSVWNSVPLNEAFVGSCWAHVARLFEIIPKGLTVKYLASPFVNRRGENDSFRNQGTIHRFKIAIEGYHRLADTFFGHDSIEAFHIRRVVRNEFGLKAFLIGKFQCQSHPEIESKALLDDLFRQAYSDPSFIGMLKRVIYIIVPMPAWLFFSVRRLYRILRYQNY